MSGASDRLPITVTVIAKDEERDLPEALDSVSFAEEVVVLDSGSRDGTVARAEARGAVVVTTDWPGYGRQKNRAAERANQPWILNLDADERVSPKLREELLALFAAGIPEEVVGFRMPRRNWFFGAFVRRCGYWPDRQLRLYRKDRARFEERSVHESVRAQGEVRDLRNPLVHMSYRRVTDFVDRQERYAALAAEELARSGRRVGLLGLLFRPLAAFLKAWILRGGCLGGWRGHILSLLQARYVGAKYARLYAKRRDTEAEAAS